MHYKPKKLISTLLSLALIFSLFAAMPIAASASTSNQIWDQIIKFGHGGTGTLDASFSGNTVTVVGSVTGATNVLDLNIDAAVTVVWKASYSSSSSYGGTLIRLNGSGMFEVAAGGSIRHIGSGDAINTAYNANVKINVSGGTLSTAGVERSAIYAGGANTVINVSGGALSATAEKGYGIYTDGADTVINVSGGTLSTSGKEGSAIRVNGLKTEITVSGGTLSATDGSAILAEGANSVVHVSGGTINAIGVSGTLEGGPDATAIRTRGTNTTVTVSGNAKVSATGTRGCAIATSNGAAINVNGGEVSSVDWMAISPNGAGSTVTVSGGRISSSNSTGIWCSDDNAKITISGGTVSSSGDGKRAIYIGGAGSTVTVCGGMVIKTTGSGFAISSGGANSSVIVESGTVSAPNGVAIFSDSDGTGFSLSIISGAVISENGYANYETIVITGTGSTATVNGGFVFNYGTGIIGEGNVIRMVSGAPTIGGTAVVCAWDKPVSGIPTYTSGTSTDLIIAPAGATATWGVSGGQNGISYSNGSNTGFYPISGVTVNAAATVAAASNLTATAGAGGITLNWTDNSDNEDMFSIYRKEDGGSFTLLLSVTANTTSFLETTAQAGKTYTYYVRAVKTGLTGANSNEATATMGAAAPAATGSMANFLQKNTYTFGMFTDVAESMWYGYYNQKVIANAYEYGLMTGNSATTFNPGGNMSIAEAITVAARVNSIYKTGMESFVQGSVWYQVYIDYAIANGIILADDFSTYTRAATRAEMAYIFSRSIPASEFASQNTVNSLPDVNGGTPYRDSILTLYRSGTLSGSDAAGTFNPGSNISRAEAAAIISRVILPLTRFNSRIYG